MTTEQLNKEKNEHMAEITTIQSQISSQISKFPVNELYGRINFLTDRIKEIDNLLCQLGDIKEVTSNNQIEKAIYVGGGGVLIRQNETNTDNPDPFSTQKCIPDPENPRIIAARSNPSQIQLTSKA